MTYDEESKTLCNWRGRRLLACRAASLLRDIIENLGKEDGSQLPPEDGLPSAPSASMLAELQNQVTSIQRMILILNDGHVSPSSLSRF